MPHHCRVRNLTCCTGRAFAILPQEWAASGYLDLCDDDKEGTLLGKLTAGVASTRFRAQPDEKASH